MVQVRGLWIPILLVAIVMVILGIFVYISLSAPEQENKVLIMSVQNPAHAGGSYSLDVYVINDLGTPYDLQAQYFALQTNQGNVAANLTASDHTPLHFVQGQAQTVHLAFDLPASGTASSLTYSDPTLTVITMTLSPL